MEHKTYEYRFVSMGRGRETLKEMNVYASEGFRVVEANENWVLMERCTGVVAR